jgi:hypothetical protein
MGQLEYNKIKEIAHRKQRIEKQILELEKNLEVAKLVDEPFEVFKFLKTSIEKLKQKQELVLAQF